jgi:hypothetical protein
MKNVLNQILAVIAVLSTFIFFWTGGPQPDAAYHPASIGLESTASPAPFDQYPTYIHSATCMPDAPEQPADATASVSAPWYCALIDGATEDLLRTYAHAEATGLQPISLSLGRFALAGSAASVTPGTTLSVSGLARADLPPLAPWLINVTGAYDGYRLLPHTPQFAEPLKICIPYDTMKIPAGYRPSDIKTYYYHETQKQWLAVPTDTIDPALGIVASSTTHFTDFINAIIQSPEAPQTNAFTPTMLSGIKAAVPTAGINIIQPPAANNSGNASIQFPIEIPAGRQGMQPQLALSYSSDGGNSWLGEGWNLQLPAITVETRWGVPKYDPNLETESYLLNGEQMLPMVHRAGFVARPVGSEKGFDVRVEGDFDTIIRYGTSPSTYWWKVIDRSGTEYYYGKYANDQGVNDNCILAHPQTGNIAHWALSEVIDLHGNHVRYFYKHITNFSHGGKVYRGTQIYPDSITYTGYNTTNGLYKIYFELEDPASALLRPDFHTDANYGFRVTEAHRLGIIYITYGSQFIRAYRLKYSTTSLTQKSNLCAVIETSDSATWQASMNIIWSRLTCSATVVLGDTPGLGLLRVHGFDYYNDTQMNFLDPQEISFSSFSETRSLSQWVPFYQGL